MPSIFSKSQANRGVYLYGMVSFFHEIVAFMNREQIPYMLSGSMALNVHTLDRTTKDFDFIVHLKKGDAALIKKNFATGFYCDEDAINDAINRKSMFNIIDPAVGFKADFIILNDDEFEQHKFNRRTKVKLFDTDVFVIAAEDLWLSKLIWIQQLQSGRQMEDITFLSRIPDLDWPYIRHWTAKLKLETFGLLK